MIEIPIELEKSVLSNLLPEGRARLQRYWSVLPIDFLVDQTDIGPKVGILNFTADGTMVPNLRMTDIASD